MYRNPESAGFDSPGKANREDQPSIGWDHPGGGSGALRCKKCKPEPKVCTGKAGNDVISPLNESKVEPQKKLRSWRRSKILGPL